MSKIENSKTYLGQELENIFFRPICSGSNNLNLGIKVLYNMPVPTTFHFWHRPDHVLHKYDSAGWTGSAAASRYTKTIDLHRVKAEISYSADEYFSLVYDNIARNAISQLDDLSGSALENAETSLFREAIRESIWATLWLGKTDRPEGLNTFDGLLHRILTDSESDELCDVLQVQSYSSINPQNVNTHLKSVWNNAPAELKAMRSEGNLAFFVTSDVYNAYEEYLDEQNSEAAYLSRQNGHNELLFKGIPVVDVKITDHLKTYFDLASSFILLTDTRNIALALNTNDFPGSEVRMWYNPDLMENRQRAIFMAGCDYLLPELISLAYEE